MSLVTVRGRRRVHQPVSRRRKDWDSVDWAQPAAVIAASMGVTKTTVHVRKHRMRQHVERQKIIWAAVDWTRPDSELVETLQAKLSLVRRQRAFWAPDTTPGAEKIRRWQKVDWDLPDVKLAQLMGVSAPHVWYWRHKLGQTKKSRRLRLGNQSASNNPS